MSENKTRIREKSIYPQPEPELVLIDTNSVLEQQIAAARRAVTSTYHSAYSRVQGVVDRWIGIEHAVESRIKSIIPADESLTPGALYVGVATLTASVLARNRSSLLRLSLPPALFLLSMNHFLPKTSHNLSLYMTSLERAHAPSLADKHEQLSRTVMSTTAAAQQAYINGKHHAVKRVERIVAELQDRTGLKLREGLDWRQGTKVEVEAEAKDLAGFVEKKVEELRK